MQGKRIFFYVTDKSDLLSASLQRLSWIRDAEDRAFTDLAFNAECPSMAFDEFFA